MNPIGQTIPVIYLHLEGSSKRRKPHEGYVEMPGRTRGDKRAISDASREYAYRHGPLLMMEHAALLSMLPTLEPTNKIIRQHSAPNVSHDLPIAYASDLPTPTSVTDVGKSHHVDWRHSNHIWSCNLVDRQDGACCVIKFCHS